MSEAQTAVYQLITESNTITGNGKKVWNSLTINHLRFIHLENNKGHQAQNYPYSSLKTERDLTFIDWSVWNSR